MEPTMETGVESAGEVAWVAERAPGNQAGEQSNLRGGQPKTRHGRFKLAPLRPVGIADKHHRPMPRRHVED